MVVDSQSLLRGHVTVAEDGGELLLLEHFVQLLGVGFLFGEDHDLVELEVVKQLDQLLDLCSFLELHEVLLESVEDKLGVAVDEELELILHELPAVVLAVTWESG